MAKANPNLTPEMAREIHRVANDLGISPLDLASVIAYESAHTFSPSIRGGVNKDGTGKGSFTGLIQFSPANQRHYGVTGEETFAQQLSKVGSYLKDRGVRPGMGLLDVYSAINAGRAGRRKDDPIYERSDVNGTQRQHAERISRDFSPTVEAAIRKAYEQPELVEFARQNELARDIEGLFGQQAQSAAPSILEGFDLVSNMNLTGAPVPTAKPMDNVPTPRDKPSLFDNFGMGTPERASQRAGARDMAASVDPSVIAAPVERVERGALRDITPETPARGLLDGFGDLTGARAALADVGNLAGLSVGSAPGFSRARDVSMADVAGIAAAGAVPEVAATPAPSVTASAVGRAGAGNGAVGTYSGRVDQPEDEKEGLMADFARPGLEMPQSVDGLLGALGAPMSVRAALDQRQREARAALPGIDEDLAPAIAQAVQAPKSVPALEAPRSIAARTVREAPTAADVKTVTGAVPEVAQNVARYGLNPDPGPGRAYGYSPWGSGVSISYSTAPDRIRDAGTGPGLFGAFKDTFGLDLTPSAGLMTGPLAMGLDAAGGAGLFSLGNMLGGSKALVDKFDVVDRATRDRVDGPQRSSSGGLLGAVSDPFGMARNELGGLFGWGGGQSAQPSASNFGGESGGFFGGIGDLLGSIFGGGGGGPADPNSRSGRMGGEGSSSARGFR